jgi:hypothetical protein
VKKVDYYAMSQPWKMPKWLGATIGAVFGVIAIGSVVAIVQLTKSPEAPKPVASAVTAPADPAAATPAPAAAQDEAAPAAAPARAERVVVAHSRHGKKDKHVKVASAKHPSAGMSDAKAHSILAKHDSKTVRSNKDSLDKLLGL